MRPAGVPAADRPVASPAPGTRAGDGRAYVAVWTAAALALLLVVVWSRSLRPTYLFFPVLPMAVAAVLIGRAWRVRRTRPFGAAGLPLLVALAVALVALGLGADAERRLALLGSDWEQLLAGRERRLSRELAERMSDVVHSGQRAAAAAAARAAVSPPTVLFAELSDIQQRTGVDAVAVLDSSGQLVAWAGSHRGRLPEPVRGPGPAIQYRAQPLFSYLYFAAPARARGERAVAVVLLQAELPIPQTGTDAVADRFAERTGVHPVFVAGGSPSAAWTLVDGGRPVLHASLQRLTQAQWRDGLATRTRYSAVLLAGLGLLLLAWSWLRHREGRQGAGSVVPLATIVLASALAPFGHALGVPRLFWPGFFVLPYLPIVVSLGALLAFALPIAALVAGTAVPVPARGRVWLAALATLLVALGFPGLLHLLLTGATAPLLEGGTALWGGLQVTAVLLLTVLAALALPLVAGMRSGRSEAEGGPLRGLLWAAGLVSVALGMIIVQLWDGVSSLSVWLAALWAIPFVMGAVALGPRAGRLARWLAVGWLSATAFLPFLWVAHVDARLRDAELEVARLGNRPDPYLNYLLVRFADEVRSRRQRGEAGVELLYRTWVSSGFAEEAYPARIMLWDAAGPREQLPLGGTSDVAGDTAPTFLRMLVGDARRGQEPVIQRVPDVRDVNLAMAVPLDSEQVVSVVVPPRRELERTTSLAPFVGREHAVETRLTLVPSKEGQPEPGPQMSWARNDEGWRGEALVQYPPDDRYHAHVQVVLPSFWVRLARAFLLTSADLAILLLLWAFGRLARGDHLAPEGGWLGVIGGFRARVTAALFLFFLLPTGVFGLVAYRALAGEVVRSARIVAENAVGQATSEFFVAMGDLEALSLHTGQDLLYYQGGELSAASNVAGMNLGVYDAWMPPAVYQVLQSGEEVSSTVEQQVAEHAYIVAYERLKPSPASVAVPVPLAAGETAIRQQELAHLILFAIVMGGLLTLLLSLAVGRALATPIGRLSRAAALVGAGRLRVQLPEHRHDEFGRLFGSFNRMTRRLRRARAQEIRSARVLAWGEMARQVAHEIKNPLTPIKLSVQHIRRAHADGRPDFPQILQSNVDQILEEIERLTDISRAFSRYGAPSGEAGPLDAVDVGAVIHDALTLYRVGDAQVSYVENVESPLPRGVARTGELKEVVLNLVENARAALEGKGTITVRARLDDGFIDVTLADDGPGIPPELLARVFEPHFSTRSTGTGLGLAIVRRLVESWGGEVTAESEPGMGTTVRVRIPVAKAGSSGETGR